LALLSSKNKRKAIKKKNGRRKLPKRPLLHIGILRRRSVVGKKTGETCPASNHQFAGKELKLTQKGSAKRNTGRRPPSEKRKTQNWKSSQEKGTYKKISNSTERDEPSLERARRGMVLGLKSIR